MPEELLDATAGSSAAEGTSADSSAGTQITDQVAGKEPPFHLHPRWQELQGQSRQLKEQNATLTQQAAQLQERLARLEEAARPKGEAPSQEYIDAAAALMKVMEANPKLKTLLSLSDAAPHLMRGYQGVQELTQAQQAGLFRQARAQVKELATKEGLPSDEDSLNLLEEMVAGMIRRDRDAHKKFLDGDVSVIGDVFDKIQKGFLSTLRREASVNLTTTKNNVKRLPPVSRGGAAGPEAPPKLEPGKEREFEKSLMKQGSAMLERLLTG